MPNPKGGINAQKVDPGEASARAEQYESLNDRAVEASTGDEGIRTKERVRAAMAKSTATRKDLDL
jgi:hypothetical protein